MRYTLESGKVVTIPDSEITNSMRLLGLTRDEAIQMYLEDEGYIINAEQEALDQKAKDNKITATIHKAKAEYQPKTQRERVAKPQPIKEEIISTIAQHLVEIGATEINVTNKTKSITFIGKDGEPYAIDLKWERNKSPTYKAKGKP
jgi:hypothetical protein